MRISDWSSDVCSSDLAVERVTMFVVLSIIILVAVFNILSSLIMLVRAKMRDIAILRTMGASRHGLIKIFVTVGVTIGALGTCAGRSEEHTSELQSLMRISYAVFCLKKKTT